MNLNLTHRYLNKIYIHLYRKSLVFVIMSSLRVDFLRVHLHKTKSNFFRSLPLLTLNLLIRHLKETLISGSLSVRTDLNAFVLSLTKTPLDRDPSSPLNRDPLGQRHPGQ